MTSAAEAKEKLLARLDETLKRQEEVKETPTLLDQQPEQVAWSFLFWGTCLCRFIRILAKNNEITGKSWVFEGENMICM